MSAPTVTLRGDEYDVVADYAEGKTPTQIAKDTGLHLDRVTGILTRRCQLDRDHARHLVNGGATIATDAAERAGEHQSPLTARIGPPARKTAAHAPRATAPPTPRPPEPPAAPPTTEPERELVDDPQPDELVIPVTDVLDIGIDALTERLRTLVAGLATAIANNHRAAAARKRITDLETQLAEARAELTALEAGGAL